jgi:hypothetical protein
MRTNDGTYTELMSLRDRLDRQHEQLQRQVDDVRKKLESVSMTLAMLDDGDSSSETSSSANVVRASSSGVSDFSSLRGMTQIEALKKLAEHGGGEFRTIDAKRIFLQVGLIKSPKNANNILFSVIQRSGLFERTAPGAYRLRTPKPIRPESKDGL